MLDKTFRNCNIMLTESPLTPFYDALTNLIRLRYRASPRFTSPQKLLGYARDFHFLARHRSHSIYALRLLKFLCFPC